MYKAWGRLRKFLCASQKVRTLRDQYDFFVKTQEHNIVSTFLNYVAWFGLINFDQPFFAISLQQCSKSIQLPLVSILLANQVPECPKSYLRTAPKGQIISECPYEKIVYPKIATKKFPRFLSWPLRRGQIKKIKAIYYTN